MKFSSSLLVLVFGSLQLISCSGNDGIIYDRDYSRERNLRTRSLASEDADANANSNADADANADADVADKDTFSNSALEALIMEEIEAEELTTEEIIGVQMMLNNGHAEEEYNQYHNDEDEVDEEHRDRELSPYGYAPRRIVRPGQSSSISASTSIRAYPNYSRVVSRPLPQPELPVANNPPPPPPPKKNPPKKKGPPKKAPPKQTPGFRPPPSFNQGIGFVGESDTGTPVVVIPARPGNALSSMLGYFRVNIGGQAVVLIVQPAAPTQSPIDIQVAIPNDPTISPRPTTDPTQNPTRQPTFSPTNHPTRTPTLAPTRRPTRTPTLQPTATPTKQPTKKPSVSPTLKPTAIPTETPTRNPTATPTKFPTRVPTEQPTNKPTANPTKNPTNVPTTSAASF